MIEFETTFPLVEASSIYEKDHEAGFESFELQEKETEGEETLPELFVSWIEQRGEQHMRLG